MKKKMLMGCIGVLVLGATVSLSNAYAHGFHHEGGYSGGLEGMFFMKAHFIMENKEALGLAQDKVTAIKSLKLETKKMLIKQGAEVQVLELDIKSKLHASPADVEALNKLVDEQAELKKTMAKSLVEAISKLKGTLTKDQTEKLHTLWEDGEKNEHKESR